ncbi:hypothetical protein G7084_05475 [Weissella coleopterorum]|uniref:Uncharacterized protein n=1 Tax=Weissella coleopterorum TaxID=2714949 RepID=A0A6G8B0E2_9LACO|nr:hypothetical protein [Weissella coleopterorum]QIL50811.1 hypothetical protein G7084_05475 [Weissella coleopterorum]
MRKITKLGQEIELPFGLDLPGYQLTSVKQTTIPSILSNSFFQGISVINIQKKLKGFRSNPELQKLLSPTLVETGISIHLDEDEMIQLVVNDNLIQNKHLIPVQTVISGQNIKVQLINVGLKDIVVNIEELIATAIIFKSYR